MGRYRIPIIQGRKLLLSTRKMLSSSLLSIADALFAPAQIGFEDTVLVRYDATLGNSCLCPSSDMTSQSQHWYPS